MKPIIGIVADVDEELCSSVGKSYTRAIEEAGGLPILLTHTESEKTILEYAALCDGFMFVGGPDVHPKRFGECVLPECGRIKEARDGFELLCFDAFFKTKKPIIAICRGVQLINVALGGTLYQDIGTQLNTEILHKQKEPKDSPSHSVKLTRGTPLWELLKADRIGANSFHHQAIKKLGKGLRVMAEADDGIIEGVFCEGQYLFGYQWHPERLTHSSEENRKIFDDFIKHSEDRK